MKTTVEFYERVLGMRMRAIFEMHGPGFSERHLWPNYCLMSKCRTPGWDIHINLPSVRYDWIWARDTMYDGTILPTAVLMAYDYDRRLRLVLRLYDCLFYDTMDDTIASRFHLNIPMLG